LAKLTGPSLNFTLADVDGSVAYVSAGRYALRNGEAARIIDFAPRDSSDWAPIPYSENPSSLAPPSGRFVTANQQPVGEDYPHYLSDYWAAPFRSMRIHELLDATQRHDVNSFLAMQRDTLSIPARLLVPAMLAGAPSNASGVESAMLETLRQWDYRFTSDSPGGTVFLTWLHAFYEQLARDEIGETLWPTMAVEPLPPVAFHVLNGRLTDWCATVGENDSADCRKLLHESLALAAARLEAELGPNPEQWSWNEATAIQHPHQIFSGLPILGSMFSRTYNFPGGPDTLMIQYVDASNAPRFTQSMFCSSFQAIYDLADLDNSLFMLSTGQSGHFRSPYYDNFLPRFAAGERFEIPTSTDAIDPVARLQLLPEQ
jgi:penicillin amidase